MPEDLRLLNDGGIQEFRNFLARARTGSTEPSPTNLLVDPSTSLSFYELIKIERNSFPSRYAFGEYLAQCFEKTDRKRIVNDFRLWTSLALYYIDQLCPSLDGRRAVLADALYILEPQFNHQRYYRHLVRTPWLSVSQHREAAKVILVTRSSSMTSEIGEQLASRQELLGNKTIMTAAYRLYFDEKEQRPKRGASGKGAGSPRRLSSVIKQLMLTYDLESCTTEQFLDLLPTEFNKFKPAKAIAAAGLASGVSSVVTGVTTD